MQKRAYACSLCQTNTQFPYVMKCCDRFICSYCAKQCRKKECPFCGAKRARMSQHEEKYALESFPRVAISDDTSNDCPKHMKLCEYFCKDCCAYLCGDCIFEQLMSKDSPHSGHNIVKLTEVSNTKETLKKEMIELQQTMDAIPTSWENFEIQLKNQKKLENDIRLIGYGLFKQIHSKFEADFHETQRPFTAAAEELRKQALVVAHMVEEAEEILTSKDGSCASQAQDFLEKMEAQIASMKAKELPLTFPELPPNQLVPQMEIMTYEIPNFPETLRKYKTLSKDEPSFIYTNEMKLFGGIWRIKIYPNGFGKGLNRYISVFVELLKAPHSSEEKICYFYTLTIKQTNGRDIVREYSSVFQQLDSWGWGCAADHDILTDPEFLHGENQSLCMEIGLRPESYKQTYLLYKTAYDKLNAKIADLQKE